MWLSDSKVRNCPKSWLNVAVDWHGIFHWAQFADAIQSVQWMKLPGWRVLVLGLCCTSGRIITIFTSGINLEKHLWPCDFWSPGSFSRDHLIAQMDHEGQFASKVICQFSDFRSVFLISCIVSTLSVHSMLNLSEYSLRSHTQPVF